MSTDHRKPVVAFVMLALAATLVIGVQHAEAQGGRLLAAAAGTGAHVQGTIASPTQTPGSPADDRLVDLGPPFFSVRDVVGHADSRTVAQDTDQSRGEPAVSRGTAVRPAGEAASSVVAVGKAGKVRKAGKEKATGRTAKPRTAANGPDSQKTAGPAGKASRSSAGKSSPGKSSWGKARKAARPGKTGEHATAHRPARASTPPGPVARTSRATGVHPSGRHHHGAHGRR